MHAILVPVALAGASVDEGRGSLYRRKKSAALWLILCRQGIEAHKPAASIRPESIPQLCRGVQMGGLDQSGVSPVQAPVWSSPVFFAASDTVWRAAAPDSNVCIQLQIMMRRKVFNYRPNRLKIKREDAL